MPTRAAIYVRISDDRAGQGLGVARQERECRDLADKRGWRVLEVYSDNSVSAYSAKRRPAYERLLDDIKNGQVDALLAWASDRLYRRYEDLASLVHLLELRPAFEIATVSSGLIDLSTPAGRMVAGQLALVARYESEQKAERHKAKHRQLAEAGREHGGGTRPYGYSADRRQLVEAEAGMVAEATDRILAGEPIRSVLRDWSARGVPTVSGKAWTVTSLKRVLTSPHSAGLRAHRGRIVTEGDWPALFGQETLRRLQAILLDPVRSVSPGPARRYLLTGWVLCGLCGARMVARPRSGGDRTYLCAKGPGFSGCGHIRTLAIPIETMVVDMIVARLDDSRLARRLSAVPDTTEREMLAAIADAEATLERLGGEYGLGEMSRPAFQAAERAVVGRLEAARAALARESRRGPVSAWVGRGSQLRAAWDELDLLARRAVLSGVLESVTVAPAVRGRNTFDSSRFSVRWRV